MTQIEFQKKYHEYATEFEHEAFIEAKKVNTEGVENEVVVPIQLDDMWCLMLSMGALATKELVDINSQLQWLPRPFVITNDETCCRILGSAYEYANSNSPDPSTKNGAILIDKNNNVLAYGVNKFPTGIAETEGRLINKKTKYQLIVHAENGAIFNAARHGRAVNDSTLYCPFYACLECAKAIIQSGVKRVVGHAQLMVLASEHMAWVESIVEAWHMMHEAGVRCELYDGTIGVTTRFNGQDIAV